MEEHYKETNFPLKLAIGEQFCNRGQEREQLKHNIATARHTVLISPRRYGKSSLVNYVVHEMSVPFASIDLFLAHDDAAITKRILEGISRAMSQIMTPSQKTLSCMQKYFSNFKLALNVAGFSIDSAYITSPNNAVELIFDALRSLARLAKDEHKKVVFFIDEFQDVHNAEQSKAIQGAIRHVAQETSDLVFIFSGSNRHLLMQIFDDQSKPLYMLCDKIFLERMLSNDYTPFLQKYAQKRWKTPLDETTLTRIFSLTELHPFYINMLCHELWKNDNIIDLTMVEQCWDRCYDLERRRLVSEVESLTLNQKKILKFLAISPTLEVTSKESFFTTKISSSSMLSGIKNLLEKDMIYQVRRYDQNLPNIVVGQYRVLDPLLSYALKKYI